MTDNGEVLLQEFVTNPYTTLDALCDRVGVRRDDALCLVAQAALDGRYSAYGLVTAHNEATRRKVFAFLANGGTMADCVRQFHLTAKTIGKWLRPLELMVEPQRPVDTALVRSDVQDALANTAIRSLQREDQIKGALAGKRVELAEKLYGKAGYFWDRAEELAKQDTIPAAALRAVVEAAHHAVRDAQLLSGEATDRVESFLEQIQNMTHAELKAYVYEERLLPRPIHQRDDARVVYGDTDGDTGASAGRGAEVLAPARAGANGSQAVRGQPRAAG